MDEALVRFMRNRYNLSIGEKTAENIKIHHGTVNGTYTKFEIRGIDTIDNIPRAITLSSSIFKTAFESVLNTISDAIIETLEQLPPDLAGDIVDRGIIFAGGGSLLRGLDGLLREKLNIPISRPDNALFCVAEGTRKILEDFDAYKSILLN